MYARKDGGDGEEDVEVKACQQYEVTRKLAMLSRKQPPPSRLRAVTSRVAAVMVVNESSSPLLSYRNLWQEAALHLQ